MPPTRYYSGKRIIEYGSIDRTGIYIYVTFCTIFYARDVTNNHREDVKFALPALAMMPSLYCVTSQKLNTAITAHATSWTRHRDENISH